MYFARVLQKRFRGGGWSAGRSHAGHERGLTLIPKGEAVPTKNLKIMQNIARKSGVLKNTYLSSFYELPTWRRAREKSERAHFSRWHYLKYCTQILQYGLKYPQRALPLAKPGVPVSNDLIDTMPVQWPKAKRDAMDEQEIRAMLDDFTKQRTARY
jgi:ribosomal protein S21